MSFFRNDPFFSSPLMFPSTTLGSPFSTFFDYPPVSAPLVTLYEVVPADEQNMTSSTKGGQALADDKRSTTGNLTTASPTNSASGQQMTTTGGSTVSTRGKRRTGRGRPSNSLFSSLPSLMSPFAPLTGQHMPSMPDMKIDMFSTDKAYHIHAAVPGLNKNDIKITVDEGVLTIEAERREEKKFRRPTSSNQQQLTGKTQGQGQLQGASSSSTTAASPTSTTTPSTSASSASPEHKYPAEESKAADVPMSDASSSQNASVDEQDDVNYHHVETFYGHVQRSVQLPEDAKVDELTAKYEDGLIKVEVPRTQQKTTRGRRVEIQ